LSLKVRNKEVITLPSRVCGSETRATFVGTGFLQAEVFQCLHN